MYGCIKFSDMMWVGNLDIMLISTDKSISKSLQIADGLQRVRGTNGWEEESSGNRTGKKSYSRNSET